MFSAESIIRPRELSCALSLGSAETMPMQGNNRVALGRPSGDNGTPPSFIPPWRSSARSEILRLAINTSP
jgi:hypothetical protein